MASNTLPVYRYCAYCGRLALSLIAFAKHKLLREAS